MLSAATLLDDSGNRLAGKRVDPTLNIIQFLTHIVYVTEDEGSVSLEVLRLGVDLSLPCSVRYSTRDGSAKAGVKYAHTEGILEFDHGEYSKTISVPLEEDDRYDATLEFDVLLTSPVAAILDEYLHTSRVVLKDDDAFPTNKFKTLINSQQVAKIPSCSLLVEYLKMAAKDRALKRSAILNIISDQFLNLKRVWNMLLFNWFLVENLLNPLSNTEIGSHPDFYIWFYVGLSLLPNVVVYALERLKAKRRIRGIAINQLQNNLMRKFMNYTEHSHLLVPQSDFIMAVSRDAPELVNMGFLGSFELIEKSGFLVILLITSVVQIPEKAWFIGVAVVFMPVVMLLFVRMRQRGTHARKNAMFRSQTQITHFAEQCMLSLRLIIDFWQKPRTLALWAEKVAASNDSTTANSLWTLTNESFGPLMTKCVVGVFILISYRDVINSGSLGSFLLGVKIMEAVGLSYQTIYNNICQLEEAIPPLQNIVYYLSLPGEVSRYLKMGAADLDKEKLALAAAHQKKCYGLSSESCPYVTSDLVVDTSVCAPDLLNFHAADLSFAYSRAGASVAPVFDRACFNIPQGKMVAVSGGHGSGKKTLLQLLGRTIMPNDGADLFIPCHLRVLHVCETPALISFIDLLPNLTFGTTDGEDASFSRVYTICKRLGFSEGFLQALENESKQKSSGIGADAVHIVGTTTSVASRSTVHVNLAMGQLTLTDRLLVHYARAFIANPEVLVFHKPFEHLPRHKAHVVMALMREFVRERGVLKPADMRSQRRPRTCFFSTAGTAGDEIDCANIVLSLARGSISEIDPRIFDALQVHARSLFSSFDANKSNSIRKDEFLQVMISDPVLKAALGTPGLSDHVNEIEELFDSIDYSGDGTVDYEELQEYLVLRLNDEVTLKPSLRSLLGFPEQVHANRDQWQVPHVPEEDPTPIVHKTIVGDLAIKV